MLNADGPALRALVSLRGQGAVDYRDLGLRLGQSRAWLEPAKHVAEILPVHSGLNQQWGEEEAGSAIGGLLLQNSDDDIRFIVNQNGLAQNIGVRMISLLPDEIRKNDNVIVSPACLLVARTRGRMRAERPTCRYRNPATQKNQ